MSAQYVALWQGKLWNVVGFMSREGKVMLREPSSTTGSIKPWIEDTVIYKRARIVK